MSWDEVLWQRSWINIAMMGNSIPQTEKDEDKSKVKEVTGKDLFNRFKK